MNMNTNLGEDKDILIRSPKISDLPAMVKLFVELMEYNAKYEPHMTLPEDEHIVFEERIRKYMKDPDKFCIFVAENILTKQVIGYYLGKIEFAWEKYHGYITHFVITSSFRKKGVGTRLFSHGCDWFKQKKLSRIELRITVNNPLSSSFWRKMGFTPYVETMFFNI